MDGGMLLKVDEDDWMMGERTPVCCWVSWMGSVFQCVGVQRKFQEIDNFSKIVDFLEFSLGLSEGQLRLQGNSPWWSVTAVCQTSPRSSSCTANVYWAMTTGTQPRKTMNAIAGAARKMTVISLAPRAISLQQSFVDLRPMGLVRITSWYPNFNGSHFGLPPSEIHRMTGLPPKIVLTMTYSHRPYCSDGAFIAYATCQVCKATLSFAFWGRIGWIGVVARPVSLAIALSGAPFSCTCSTPDASQHSLTWYTNYIRPPWADVHKVALDTPMLNFKFFVFQGKFSKHRQFFGGANFVWRAKSTH